MDLFVWYLNKEYVKVLSVLLRCQITCLTQQVYSLTQKVEELLDEMRGRRSTKKPMKNADQPKTAVPLTKATHTAVSNSVNGAVKMSDNGPVPNSVNEAAWKPASDAVSNFVNDADMDVSPPPSNEEFEFQRRARRSSKRNARLIAMSQLPPPPRPNTSQRQRKKMKHVAHLLSSCVRKISDPASWIN
ncbi:hypothetical protein HHI36_004188 [Cryptolaemus montrouzieri]|uniref:Uncharacterized protein n=1 Tax=Cryptolaemus montrouzieri TaxID=559131 RepID=A0ABD2NQG7_9CUCU